jgi:hypothetical protein
MSAVSRMLGRWMTGGCGCQANGPDCAGHDQDTRRRKRQEQRTVRREVDEALRERPARTSYLIHYGPDWPPAPNPAPGAPPRRPEPARMTLGQRCLATVVLTVVAWGAGAIVLHAIDPTPAMTVPVVVWHDTTPPSPHVATSRHARKPH